MRDISNRRQAVELGLEVNDDKRVILILGKNRIRALRCAARPAGGSGPPARGGRGTVRRVTGRWAGNVAAPATGCGVPAPGGIGRRDQVTTHRGTCRQQS